MLFINDLTYRIAGRTLLDKVSLTIPSGHRVGLVGPNGTGKSTLFKLISGELDSDGGDVSFIKDTSIGWVRQDLPDDETPIIDIILNSDEERRQLLEETETAEPERLGDIYERLAEIGAYEAPARAAIILSGLGFNDVAQNMPISSFSGGWRARIALAVALFKEPNLLMLDEPTNHLDFEAMVWLENYLLNYRHTLLIISHDRDILNKTVTQIVHLDNQKLVSYTGSYDQFERKRAEKMLGQQALHEKQMAQKSKMMEFVNRFGASASKAKQAQSRLKMIEKMDVVDAVIAERVTAFVFPDPEPLKAALITLDHVDVGYTAGVPILKKLNLTVAADDRIALLGANGNGKSTLVKLLSGKLPHSGGEVHKSSKLRVGYFAQFQTDELDVNETPLQVIMAAMVGVSESKVRASLAQFGFDKNKIITRIGDLSGGEKARLLFCRMSLDAPHIMLLDEPTNHLDIEAREALTQALNNYQGAVILVSHDPHLVECVADRLWLVADGSCTNFDDDLEAYKKLVVQQRRKEREENRAASRADKKEGKKGGKKSGGKQGSLEQQIEAVEEQMRLLTTQKDALENDLAAHAVGDAKGLKDINRAYTDVVAALAAAEKELDGLIAGL
jgi:ATP-binding cassette subfamily F protein 3